MKAYKFIETAREVKPVTEITSLLERCEQGEKLSRSEKNKIATIFYGIFGSQFPGYRLAGWCWTLSDCLPEFIVEFTYGGFQSFRAYDKTALRASGLSNIKRIISVK